MPAEQPRTPQPIVYMIIGTACLVVICSVAANIFITIHNIPTDAAFLVLKDVLLTTLGALLGFLANTRAAPSKDDQKVEEVTTTTTKVESPNP